MHNVPVQSLIDHIKTAIDVDPWAKEMVENLLKEQPEIVRCMECRYGQYCTDGETTYQCFKWNSGEFGMLHEQNWFCADAEQRG